MHAYSQRLTARSRIVTTGLAADLQRVFRHLPRPPHAQINPMPDIDRNHISKFSRAPTLTGRLQETARVKRGHMRSFKTLELSVHSKLTLVFEVAIIRASVDGLQALERVSRSTAPRPSVLRESQESFQYRGVQRSAAAASTRQYV